MCDVVVFIVFGLVSLGVIALVAPLLGLQASTVRRNTTLIEDNYANKENPFDQGRITANIADIFGTCGADWLIPVMPHAPVTDGVCFSRGLKNFDHDGRELLDPDF